GFGGEAVENRAYGLEHDPFHGRHGRRRCTSVEAVGPREGSVRRVHRADAPLAFFAFDRREVAGDVEVLAVPGAGGDRVGVRRDGFALPQRAFPDVTAFQRVEDAVFVRRAH